MKSIDQKLGDMYGLLLCASVDACTVTLIYPIGSCRKKPVGSVLDDAVESQWVEY